MAAQTAAEELKAAGINPRTKEPYKRAGGAYNKDKNNSAAADIAKVAAAAKAEAKKAAELEKTAAARAELAILKSQNESLQSELQALKASMEGAKQAAVLQATQKMAEQMLQRYKDGLRDGASLSRGGLAVNLASSSTPDSSADVGASPW